MFKFFKPIIFVSIFLMLSILNQGCQITVGNHRHEKSLSENVYSQMYTLMLEPEEFATLDRIYISGHVIHDPLVTPSPLDQLSLQVTLYSSSPSGTQDFITRNITASPSQDRNSLNVSWEGGNYFCRYYELNGRISVEGTCVGSLVIAIPQNARTKVILRNDFGTVSYTNRDNHIIKRLFSGDTVEELLTMVERASFPNDKLELVKNFLSENEGRVFYVRDVARLLKEMTLAQDELPQLLSGRVIDTENVIELADDFIFSFEREEKLKLLAK